jgi:hypothetical protein
LGVRPEHVAYVGEVPQRGVTRPRGKAVGGARLDQAQCRTAEECGKLIVEDYRRETEKMREPPDPAEELLRGGLSWRRLALSG